MSKFTKEEISLCKQVAERHRKDINYGDWFYWEYGGTHPVLCNDGGLVHYKRYKNKKKSFPLWTISDCLEFLQKKEGYDWNLKSAGGCKQFFFQQSSPLRYDGTGKTLLEACLRAVLAVLKEEG